jgi:hypothetical protein
MINSNQRLARKTARKNSPLRSQRDAEKEGVLKYFSLCG